MQDAPVVVPHLPYFPTCTRKRKLEAWDPHALSNHHLPIRQVTDMSWTHPN
jgi:hypothetical protein